MFNLTKELNGKLSEWKFAFSLSHIMQYTFCLISISSYFLNSNANLVKLRTITIVIKFVLFAGISQAHLVGQRLKELNITFHRFIASSSVRAAETADIVHQYLNYTHLERDPILKEGWPLYPEPAQPGWNPLHPVGGAGWVDGVEKLSTFLIGPVLWKCPHITSSWDYFNINFEIWNFTGSINVFYFVLSRLIWTFGLFICNLLK